MGDTWVGHTRIQVLFSKIVSGKNQIGFKSSTVQFEFGLSMFGSLRISHYGSGLNEVNALFGEHLFEELFGQKEFF